MRENNRGKLYSVDNFKALDPSIKDFLIRGNVRDRWELIIGDIREVLPNLLSRLQSVDFFYHDLCNSHHLKLFEISTVVPYLNKNGYLASHCSITLLFEKDALKNICKKYNLEYNIFRDIAIGYNQS